MLFDYDEKKGFVVDGVEQCLMLTAHPPPAGQGSGGPFPQH